MKPIFIKYLDKRLILTFVGILSLLIVSAFYPMQKLLVMYLLCTVVVLGTYFLCLLDAAIGTFKSDLYSYYGTLANQLQLIVDDLLYQTAILDKPSYNMCQMARERECVEALLYIYDNKPRLAPTAVYWWPKEQIEPRLNFLNMHIELLEHKIEKHYEKTLYI